MAERKRARVTRSADLSTLDDGTACCFCGDAIPYLDPLTELRPCRCKAHPNCLLDAHASRGTSLLSCPQCGFDVESHQHFQGGRTPSSQAVVPYNKSGCVLSEAALKLLPFQLLCKKRKAVEDGEIAQASVLFAASLTPSKDPEKTLDVDYVSKIVVRTANGFSQATCDRICEFSAWLYPRITKLSLTTRKDVTTFAPRELLMHRTKQYTPLFALLFGLATGTEGPNLNKVLAKGVFQDFQSQYLAVCAAHDIVLRCTARYPLHFQRMMSHQLGQQPVSNMYHDILSAFRVSASHSYSNVRQSAVVVKGLLAGGGRFGPEDFHLLNGDNIGYKKGGAKPGYNSFVLFQGHRITSERLHEIKIYSDVPGEQLSRELANDWLELCRQDQLTEIDLASDLVDPTDEDYNTLTHCVLANIKLARDLDVGKQFGVNKMIPRAGYIINEETRRRLEASEIGADLEMLEDSDDEDEAEEVGGSADAAAAQQSRTEPPVVQHPSPFYGPNVSCIQSIKIYQKRPPSA